MLTLMRWQAMREVGEAQQDFFGALITLASLPYLLFAVLAASPAGGDLRGVWAFLFCGDFAGSLLVMAYHKGLRAGQGPRQ